MTPAGNDPYSCPIPVLDPLDDRALHLLLALLSDDAALRRALGPPVLIRRQRLARVAVVGTVRPSADSADRDRPSRRRCGWRPPG